jgi:cyclic pyranopterin phosphate synthase
MKKDESSGKQAAFSHLDMQGNAQMVNVGAKIVQYRQAIAEGFLLCSPDTIDLLRKQALPKGDVLTVAQIAGIQAAKRTPELIPLCHSLPLDGIAVNFSVESDRIRIHASVSNSARTGVEMEALTAVSVAALTLYDMCKAVDKGMSIEGIRVLQKIKS